MIWLRKKFEGSPEFARVAPLFIFVALIFLQGKPDEASHYWMYLVRTAVGAWLLWEMRPYVQEMRWSLSWEAVAMGVAIFVIWVGLDGLYPRLSQPEGKNPFDVFGPNATGAWICLVGHLLGSAIVVPPLEEVFYRSFLYRYLVTTNFLEMPLNRYHALSFFVTSIGFGLVHPDRWVAGILCGLGYQWLVLRKNRLGDAMLAHGITNFLLGLWVIWKGAWSFW